MKTTFCYEIQAEAGIAIDTQSGKFARALTKLELDHAKPLTDEMYKAAHEGQVLFMVAEQIHVNPIHLKPISEEDFEKEHEECKHCREH